MTTGTGLWPSTGQAANGVKTALYGAITAALAADEEGVTVAFGYPLNPAHLDVVAVTAVRVVPQDDRVSPTRRREAQVDVDVLIASWRVTADEQVTHARAFGLLDAIDQHLLEDPTVDGAALWCLCSSVESDGATTEDDAGQGRLTEVAATFQATVMITR